MTLAQTLWNCGALLAGIIVPPGMDMFCLMAKALTGGRRLGLAATAGVMLGGVFHTVFGAAMVGVIAGLSPVAYGVLLFGGAAYMGWVGLTLLGSSIRVAGVGDMSVRSGWASFRQGAVTCMLNPKAYLFTLAVYPQFIRAEFGPVWLQALAMGALTALMQGGFYGGLALMAATARDWLVQGPAAVVWVGRVAGAGFLAVAIARAWQGLAG